MNKRCFFDQNQTKCESAKRIGAKRKDLLFQNGFMMLEVARFLTFNNCLTLRSCCMDAKQCWTSVAVLKRTNNWNFPYEVKFHTTSFFPHVRNLVFSAQTYSKDDISNSTRKMYTLYLPPELKVLKIDCRSEFLLIESFPNKLVDINLYNCSKNVASQILQPGRLPKSLTKLNMGVYYCDDLKPGVFPESLLILKLSGQLHRNCNSRGRSHPIGEGILKPGVLPNQLQYLRSDVFTQPFQLGKLPISLRELKLRAILYPDPFLENNLPTSLNKLTINEIYWSNFIPTSLTNLKLRMNHYFSEQFDTNKLKFFLQSLTLLKVLKLEAVRTRAIFSPIDNPNANNTIFPLQLQRLKIKFFQLHFESQMLNLSLSKFSSYFFLTRLTLHFTTCSGICLDLSNLPRCLEILKINTNRALRITCKNSPKALQYLQIMCFHIEHLEKGFLADLEIWFEEFRYYVSRYDKYIIFRFIRKN